MTEAETDLTAKPAWWISWYSPEALGGFELHWPWWRSGWTIERDGTEKTVLVAAVRADTEDEAFEIIESAYLEKPEDGVERRFCDKLEDGETMPWEHEGTRFPLMDWQEWV